MMHRPKSGNKLLVDVLCYLILIIVCVIFLLPIYWVVTTSLKLPIEIFELPPKWIFVPTLENYIQLLKTVDFISCYVNSIIVASSSTILSLALGFPTAYALARFRIKRKEDIAFWILSTRFTPAVAIAIPIFILFQHLRLLNTYPALILVHTLMNLPLAVWMLRGFIESIPPELEQAALVDGCSESQAILRITIPLSLTGIIATGVLCFIFSWNEFLFALLLTGVETRTAAVMMYCFIGFSEIRWGQMCSAAVLVSIPVIIFGILVRKYLIAGLTFGTIKG